MSAKLTSDASDAGTAPGGTVVAPERPPALRLDIVILFMGSRGDLQPSVAIARRLQERHGHRVRIASHPPYRAVVEAAGVDFYSIGGCDIRAMMRRRLLPRDELRKQVPAIREEFWEMGTRWWGACVGEGYEEDEKGEGGKKEEDGFVADLVVSSMIVFNQTSAAARLGVPLHLFGMNPRIYSKELPHSQAGWAVGGGRVKRDLSWWLQDFMFLHTIKSVFNDVRFAMGLEPMSPAWWLSQYNRLDVPCTYLWSPLLLPKPSDWADNIRVSGFVFDDAPESYVPPENLVSFIEAADTPPVYIGFGSMTFVNAQEVFQRIFEVLREMGVRAVVCKGWSDFVWEEVGEKGGRGGTGADGMENVLMIDEAPHAWLFPRCRAVVCHGGSGTTAMALRSGRPTLVIPVAGDQPFWGSRVAAVGCGPAPGFGITELTVEKFRTSLGELLKPEYARAAEKFGDEVARERPGEDVCVEDLLETVSVYEKWRCEVFPARPAVWSVGGRRLSAVAAEVLVKEGRVRREQLRAADVVKWPDLVSPGDPVTGLFFGVKSVIDGLKKKAALGVLLHILRAPLTILASVTFGMFNLVEFLLFELASPFKPRMFASNPRVYSYGQMLTFLVSAPAVELGSLASQPGVLKKKGRSTGRVVAEVPLAIARTLIASVNVVIGFVGISLRQADLACAKATGERPRRDVVAEARFRQGRIEAERFAVERAEEGGDLRAEILRAWDEKKA